MLKEFRDFAMKGNVVDLAVAVIIGAAFGAIVNSLVADVIMPADWRALAASIFRTISWRCRKTSRRPIWPMPRSRAPSWPTAVFITVTLNFIIVAFVMFIVIRLMNQFKRKEAAAPGGAAEADARGRTVDRDS